MELGLGLIGIGRKWGHIEKSIPSKDEVFEFLNESIKLGIRSFDTAPAYGVSEQRFGKFLKNLSEKEILDLQIATKCGEHWDPKTNNTYVDHSYEALCRSIDQSFNNLPKIDILQIHKASPQVLRDPEVKKALNYARSKEVKIFGASISDLDSANIAIHDPMISVLQFPFNITNKTFESIFETAKVKGKTIFINRPLGMGSIMYDNQGGLHHTDMLQTAYETIINKNFNGVILSGTSSIEHLKQNIGAFNSAKRNLVFKKGAFKSPLT